MRIVIVSFALILLGAIQGCGLKGPLYLPEPTKPAEPTSTEQNDTEEDDTEQDGRKKIPSQPTPSTTP
jgi:predicted small lipoprotein YifL